MWLDVIIQWIKAFFGTVVFWTGVAGVLLVLITMIRYRVRRGKEAGTAVQTANEKFETPDASVAADFSGNGVSVDSETVKRIALITGASSGIGRAFALRIDQTEAEIDEIWLVARRQEKLEALAGELKHETRIIAADLMEGLDAENYENPLTRALAGETELYVDSQRRELSGEANPKKRVQIRILVNAAGFAKIGNYAKVSFQDSMRMIDLNDKAAVAVTLACLPYMNQGDRILQMCSTAAFQPLQHINIYGASKAFLYHYTRALRLELFPRGIMVTAVCPFWVKDTEFIGIAKGDGANPPIKHFPFATTAEKVVKRGLRASRAGWAVVTPGAFCVIHRFFTKLLPREAAIWIWELMRRV